MNGLTVWGIGTVVFGLFVRNLAREGGIVGDKALRIFMILFYGWIIATFLALTECVRADSIEGTIRSVAIENGFDPNLAVAIAKTESGLNPKAVGKHGEFGVFQLHPKYHGRPKSVREQSRVAIRYLIEIRKQCEVKYGEAWWIAYNVGPNYPKPIRHPKLFPYYRRVSSHLISGEDYQ